MDRQIEITVAEQRLNAIKMIGKEALSSPFHFAVTILQDRNDVRPTSLLGCPATLTLEQPSAINDPISRTISGIVMGVDEEVIDTSGHAITTLHLEPRLARARLQSGPRVILKQTIQEIAETILLQQGYIKGQYRFHLNSEYPAKNYRLQVPYENDLDFLHRLLAASGIFYWCGCTNGKEMIHFGDHHQACPLYNDVLIHRPENDLRQPLGLYKICPEENITPGASEISEHDEMQPFEKLHASHTIQPTQCTTSWIFHRYGTGATTTHSTQRNARLYAECMATSRFIIKGEGNHHGLMTGYRVKLQADTFDPAINGIYLIRSITHRIEQPIEYLGHNAPYQNNVRLHPNATPFRPSVPPHPRFPGMLTARIESHGERPQLDNYGRYTIRQHLDRSNPPQGQASPPIPRLSPYGGPRSETASSNVGWHMSLYDGAEVLVGALNGDPDRPILLGTVPNTEQASPVDANNHTQNRFRTAADNELMMDDLINRERIVLRTYQGKNRLEMDATKGNHRLILASVEGTQEWVAAKTGSMHSTENILERIKKNRVILAKKNIITKTERGDMHYQSAADMRIRVGQGSVLKSAGNTEINAGKRLNIEAKNDIDLTSESGDVLFETINGKLLIEAENGITLQGDGSGDLTVGRAGAGITLTSDGVIEFYGRNINFSPGNGEVRLAGKVNRIAAPAPPQFPKQLDEAHEPQPIPELKQTENNIDVIDTQLTIHFHWNICSSTPDKHGFLNGVRYRVVARPDQGNTQHFEGLIQKSKIRIEHIDLDVPFSIQLTDTRITPHQACYIIGQDQRVMPPTTILRIKPLQQSNKHYETQKPNRTTQIRSLGLTVIHPPIQFDFRINSPDHLREHAEKAGITLSSEDLKTIEENLKFFQVDTDTLNHRGGNNKSRTRQLFTDEEIAYLKANGNNATLFIHGFNVPSGRFGKSFILQDNDQPWIPHIDTLIENRIRFNDAGRNLNQPSIVDFSDLDSALYRNPGANIPIPYENSAPWQVSAVNGEGAHRWLTSMTHHINRATGAFTGKDYSLYAPMIGIIWQGKPTNELDYMAVVSLVKYTAMFMIPMIEQLIDAGIQVNVIAHSLGNLVLMHMLETLGQKRPEAINHAFMWQAAIPQTAFKRTSSNNPIEKKYYYFPHAIDGTKKITVLYSEQDNILGPLPYYQFLEMQKFLKDKAFENEGGWLFAALALTIHHIDRGIAKVNNTQKENQGSRKIASIYHLSNTIGIPLSTLLESHEARYSYYQHLRRRHIKNNINEQAPPYSFSVQCATIHKKYPAAYNYLTFIVKCIAEWFREKGPLSSDDKWELCTGIERLHIMGYLPDAFKVSHVMLREYIDPTGNEMATLIITALSCQQPAPTPAMGYLGPDSETRKQFKNKIIAINQGSYLTGHSAMLEPSEALMNHIYKRHIGGTAGYLFGRYNQPLHKI